MKRRTAVFSRAQRKPGAAGAAICLAKTALRHAGTSNSTLSDRQDTS
jgi:hypothetical protein